MNNKLLWAGMLDFSAVDYPGKPCAIMFLCGCPFRCPWCHSPELALADPNSCVEKNIDEIVERLKQNFVISAVSITGGEPLMQPTTIELLKLIKTETTLLTKIDSNCYFPEQTEKALPFLDAISIDIKAPLTSEKYAVAVGKKDLENLIERIKQSHDLLKQWKTSHPNFLIEVRTTIVPEINDKQEDIQQICQQINYIGADIYTLQQFRPTKTLATAYKAKKQPKREKIIALAKVAKSVLKKTKVRIVTEENGFEDIE